jgi:hypothetical protein
MAEFTDYNELAPALDVEPVYERPAEGRWEQAQVPETTHGGQDFGATGAWADGRSFFDIPELAGPAFVDPGTFALQSYLAPDFRATTFATGAIANASADLDSPIFGGGGGGGDDKNKNKGKGSPGGLF